VVYADEASRARNPEWSRDGKSIYYYNGAALVERNLTSGAEREIIRIPRLNWDMSLSPDGRYFAVQTNEDPSTKTSSLLLVPVQGGQPRELLRSTQPDEWSSALRTKAWTPDSRAVIVTKKSGSGLDLLLVPITGGPARKLDIDAESWTRGNQGDFDQGFSLSPDGSHVAFLMGKSASEVWALENFLPALSAKK
jgi:Tol biopolymer transport system component